MLFEARLFDPSTRTVQLRQLHATDEPAARALLAGEGATVLALQPSRARPKREEPTQRHDLALLCRELRALLQAGLSVVEALDALGAAAGSDSIYQRLLARLREGKALSTAMQDVGGFPPLLVASVRASERTSDLTHALDAYLRFDDMVGALRRKVISAALYPALVVGLGGLIAIFLLLVVIPRFAALYGESAAADVSVATRALLAFSATLSERPWLMPMVLFGLVALLAWAGTGSRPRQAGAWLVAHWTWLGRQVAHFEYARLFEALALLVHGGYSLHEALGVCLTLANGRSHEKLVQARQRIEQGASASAGFGSAGLTDAVTERLIRAGERGGDFDRVLRAIAERHRQTFETFVERATRIVEPVLLLGVALMVGSMVVLLYMPVFDIAASVR
jgi:general secretion pathway protein F